uniref:hypothetical protein n=1 Tax=Flavobacterium sp. TaxID=239 RepID=UPI004049CE5F
MKTLAISLIEKKPHQDGGTYDFLKSLEVFLIKKEASTIILQEIIQQKESPVLLEIQNNQLTTLLDCTGVTPYEIWYFNDQLQFTGKAYSLNENGGTFKIQTQAKWVLFIHLVSKVFDDLKHFKGSELDITDKYGIVKKTFPSGYGVFPYLIINQEKSPCFSQIPIHINPSEENLPGWSIEMDGYITKSDDLLKNKLREEAKEYFNLVCKKLDGTTKMALVINANEAYYFKGENEVSFNESIPSGGVLLDVNGKQIANNSNHYL